jgi:hypothetical protein
MSSEINVLVKTVVGETLPLRIASDATIDTLKQMIKEKEGWTNEEFRLMGQAKELQAGMRLTDYNIGNNDTVYVVLRLPGGGQCDPETLMMVLAIDLPGAITAVKKTKGKCCICLDEDVPCVRVHTCEEALMCTECITKHIKADKYEPECPICRQRVKLELVLPNCGLDNLVQELREVTTMLQHVDLQMCRCGALCTVNDGKLADSLCISCKRRFCFFCNEDWDSAKMKNGKYSCGQNCFYTNMLNFELQPLKLSVEPGVSVPGMRICTKCGVPGAYGNRCKYHTCTNCGHDFCFICLKAKADCSKVDAGSYGKKCIKKDDDIPRQTYRDFKHAFAK